MYSTKIQNHEKIGETVTYFIIIVNHSNGLINTIRKRYSELKSFHEKLSKIISSYKLNVCLPLFPGRKLFGSTNKNDDSIK
jgi:hypothetical protein